MRQMAKSWISPSTIGRNQWHGTLTLVSPYQPAAWRLCVVRRQPHGSEENGGQTHELPLPLAAYSDNDMITLLLGLQLRAGGLCKITATTKHQSGVAFPAST